MIVPAIFVFEQLNRFNSPCGQVVKSTDFFTTLIIRSFSVGLSSAQVSQVLISQSHMSQNNLERDVKLDNYNKSALLW